MAEETKPVKKATKAASASKPTKAPAKAKKAEAPVEKPEAPAEKPAKKPAAKKPAKPAAEKPAKKKKEEPVAPAKPKVTEARAFARDVRVAPRKVRLVADLVRGKSVKDALGILAVCNKVGALPVEKIIRSAAANAINNFGMDEKTLYIAEIQVGDGLKIKRYIPRAKGSASGIIKRNSHIRIIVKERN